MKAKTIHMTDQWAEELKSMPFTSRKNGKMLNLLKASAKPINKHKKRKVVPLFGTIQEYHASSQSNLNFNGMNSQPGNVNFTIGTGSEIRGDESEANQSDFNI